MPINKMLKSILSSSGMSLTEVLIGGSILAGVALSSAKLFKDQKFAQKRIEYDQKLANYHKNLSQTLNQSANCNATLKMYVAAGSGIPVAPQNIPRIYHCIPVAGVNKCSDDNLVADKSFDAYTPGAYSGTSLIAVGQYIDTTETWKINNISLIGRLNTGRITFKVTYDFNPKMGQPKVITKDILVNVRYSGGVFKECFNSQESTVNTLQNDLCKSLNLSEGITASDGRMARWDDATQTCLVDGAKDCSALGLQLDGVSPDGVVRCKNIVNPTDANDLQDPSTQACARPELYFDTLGRKMRIRCAP